MSVRASGCWSILCKMIVSGWGGGACWIVSGEDGRDEVSEE
jgi:hypothetical protein